MTVSRLAVAWRQFSPMQALRITAAAVARRLLDRYAEPSYGQTGEDRVIEALLGNDTSLKPGFYVDVGANHPIRFSNTYALYRKGWRGIAIEPNAQLVERHRRTRRRDCVVCAIVSDETRDVIFTEFVEPLVSSVDESHVRTWEAQHPVVSRRSVKPRTLTDILTAEGAPPQFDLLSVDCEGHDLSVLRSLDFSRFRPRLIVAEAHGLKIADATRHPMATFLAGHGYQMVGYVAENAYFVLEKR
jgi:FkbM family methyltransferase